MDWVNGFIIPLVEIVVISGIILAILYFVFKGFRNAWQKQTKFFFRYKILRKKYPEELVKYCMDNINEGIGYYDTKKILMIEMVNPKEVNEMMYVYDIILNQMKGGRKKHE